MSLIRLLPARLHAVADYAVAAALILVPLIIIKGSTLAVDTGVLIGIVVAVVSALTRYPLGIVKVLPFTVHSAGDYLVVVLLIASPFSLRFDHTDPHLSVFYIAAGLAVLAVSVITDYQYSPKLAGMPAQQAAPVQEPVPAQQPVPVQQPVPAQQPASAFQQAPVRPGPAQTAPMQTVPLLQAAPACQAAAAEQAWAEQIAAEQAAAEQAWAAQAAVVHETAELAAAE